MHKYFNEYNVHIFKANQVEVGEHFYCRIKQFQTLLSTPANNTKGNSYKLLHGWLGRGLLTRYSKWISKNLFEINVYSAGEQWHQQRKFLTPTFHFKILNGFAITMNECAATCANNLKEKLLSSGTKEITLDICPLISLCTLDIICETSMGKKLSKLFT